MSADPGPGESDDEAMTNGRTVDEVPEHCGRPMLPIRYGMIAEPPDPVDPDFIVGGCDLAADNPAFGCPVCEATAGTVPPPPMFRGRVVRGVKSARRRRTAPPRRSEDDPGPE